MVKPKTRLQAEQKKTPPPKSEKKKISWPLHHLIAIGLIAGLALVVYSGYVSGSFPF